jgi:hypothetical protein
MLKDISEVSDLPAETIEEYKRHGWTDEEIVENLNDAINFLNSHLRSSSEPPDKIPARFIFSDPC